MSHKVCIDLEKKMNANPNNAAEWGSLATGPKYIYYRLIAIIID